jgi:hypothetical protein
MLVAWYFVRSWRARKADGGLLRWTVASAIGAALLHGMIDVPWHRPALGWFLLVVALVALPSTGRALHRPFFWRVAQVFAGLFALASGTYLAWAASTGHPPLVYRWEAYDRKLKELAVARRHDDGELAASEVVRDFPLHYQAYYWRAAFLRTFSGTEGEIEADIAAGRFVEPVLPVVAAEQARLWAGISDTSEAEARAEAVRRAALIEVRTGTRGMVEAEVGKGLRGAADRPAVQLDLRKRLCGDPVLLAYWTSSAGPELVDEYLVSLGVGVYAWLDSLPSDLRGQVLDRWIALPSAAAAVAYMEERNAPASEAYWRQLANYYAKAGDKARAVGIVAVEEGVALDGGVPDGAFARELAALRGQGNEVAVRRLIREAVEGKEADAERLRVAMAAYAAAGDWEMAWKAASRLVTARKNGQ